MRPAIVSATLLLSTLGLAAELAEPDPATGKLRLLTDSDAVVLHRDGLTVVATLRGFSILEPEGRITEFGIVAQVIDDTSGTRVAELIGSERLGLVAWELYGDGLGSGPTQRGAVPLSDVPSAARDFRSEPGKALGWTADFLWNLWLDPPRTEIGGMDDEPGCCGLHWLDDSTVRPCCDDHDLCYETYLCDATSWNPFTGAWECDQCNVDVVACFAFDILLDGLFWEWCLLPSCCGGPLEAPCIIVECT